MSADGTPAEAVLYWWNKALESLKAARRELAADAYTFAINRAYYALFYAVSALLLEEGRRFSKHSGDGAAFNRDIIRSGLLSRKYGDLYNQLFGDRQESELVVFTAFDGPYVQDKIDACEECLTHLRPLLKSLPSDMEER